MRLVISSSSSGDRGLRSICIGRPSTVISWAGTSEAGQVAVDIGLAEVVASIALDERDLERFELFDERWQRVAVPVATASQGFLGGEQAIGFVIGVGHIAAPNLGMG